MKKREVKVQVKMDEKLKKAAYRNSNSPKSHDEESKHGASRRDAETDSWGEPSDPAASP